VYSRSVGWDYGLIDALDEFPLKQNRGGERGVIGVSARSRLGVAALLHFFVPPLPVLHHDHKLNTVPSRHACFYSAGGPSTVRPECAQPSYKTVITSAPCAAAMMRRRPKRRDISDPDLIFWSICITRYVLFLILTLVALCDDTNTFW
jgi:hypothetical protein